MASSLAAAALSRAVLLVGQEEGFRRLLEVTLPGFVVEQADQLSHAMEALQEGKFALVLIELDSAPAGLASVIESLSHPAIWAVTLREEQAGRAPELIAAGVERLFYHPVAAPHLARQLTWLLGLEGARAQAPSPPALPEPSAPPAGAPSTLISRFLETSRERVGRILARASLESDLEERTELAREAHRLVGSLGSFGFPLGSTKARQLEGLLQAGPLESATLSQVTSLCQDLFELLDELPDPTLVAAGTVPGTHQPVVGLITHDDALRREMSEGSSRFGLRVVSPPLASLAEFLRSAATDAVVYDFSSLPPLTPEIAELLRHMVCPVVALCPPLSLKERVQISGLGVASVIEKPLALDSLLGSLQNLLSLPVACRVLAIDDDPLFLEQLEAFIVPLGTSFTGVTEPEALWSALQSQDPDLLLLDIDMPEIDGLALCRAVRSDPRFQELPVVFITGNLSPEVRREAYEAGGEDYITKSISGAELRIRIAARLRRVRTARRADRDGLTGLLSRAPGVKALEHLLKLAERRELPVSLAIIDVDHFKLVNDRFGHPVGDEVLAKLANHLRQSLRGEDVVARWGGEEFVVGLFLATKAQAAQRLRICLAEWTALTLVAKEGEFHSSFSAGVAQFPHDGRGLDALYAAADRALYEAKKERGKVQEFVPQGEASDPLDVILVEDDHPLGTVLMEAFAEQGWRAKWFQDGAEAADVLLDAERPLNPSVLVIDRELPTLDGVELVRRLSSAGLCRRHRVIIVSAKLSRAEIEQLLDLGVFDHLSKPFSLPVLMRRIDVARARREQF